MDWIFTLLLLVLSIPVIRTRIWSIQMGTQYGGHEYFDKDGYHAGFGVDLVDKVCQEAGMDCRIVVDAYSQCWKDSPGEISTAGEGLLKRRFDGCLGWLATVSRIHTMTFSQPYLKQHEYAFYVLKGKASSFNMRDFSNTKIAFMNGASANRNCVARMDEIANNDLPPNQVILKPTVAPLLQALIDGEADAVFGFDLYWTEDQLNQMDKIPKKFTCSLSGGSLMARKDNPIIQAWNIGFNKLKNTNGYTKFCEEIGPKHANKGTVECLDN